jgi:LysR family cyn operon transcriptional activator
MELRHLRYFVALAEHLSFTRAAARVHVTQSTLSHQIRQLEEELGQPLFDRIGKKVVTTEAGELFLGFAVRALKEVDHGLAVLKPSAAGLAGRVRIGTTHTFNIGLIPVEPRSVEETQHYIAAEAQKWGELIRKLGLAGSQ